MQKANTLTLNVASLNSRAINAALGVLFFIIATTLAAYIRIPIKGSPVPITLQTFFVIMSGAVLGKKLGSCSQLGYLALGAVGLPVFQGYAFGISHILGPTGGYLIGFVFASALVGKMLSGDRINTYRTVIAFTAGILVIYSLGVLWLAVIYRANIFQAISIGALPFMIGDMAKILLASMIYKNVHKRVKL